jgi:TRAP-type C4-dicarboxylate transport system permease small subunit
LAWLSRGLAVLEGAGIGLCLVAVVVLSTWQFVERNMVQSSMPSVRSFAHGLTFFKVPVWVDGVIRHSVFMLGFLGGAYATYTGRHIRFDAVTRVATGKKRLALRTLTTAAAIFFVLVFAGACYDFYKVLIEESGEASQAQELFTPARGAMIMVVGYLVIAFHFLVEWLIDIGWLISKSGPPPEWISEAGAHGEVPPEEIEHVTGQPS